MSEAGKKKSLLQTNKQEQKNKKDKRKTEKWEKQRNHTKNKNILPPANSNNDNELQQETQPTSYTDKQTSASHINNTNDNQSRVWHKGNILPSEPDYEWCIYNHAFRAHQERKNSQTLHLSHQLLMEITPGNLVDDIKLICPQYAKKIMYISKNKQTGLQDFGTLPLGSRCDLVLNTIFCKQNKSKLIFHHLKQTFLFPFQLPNSKYRTIIVNTREDTITCCTTEHCMLQPEKNQAQTIMQALDKNIQTQKLTWAENNPSGKTRTTFASLKTPSKKLVP